jgi:hypothetical protein
MSAKLFLSESIIPQPDFEATEEENGQWKANQSFLVKKGDFNNLATRLFFARGRNPKDLDLNNDAYFNFLKLKTTSVGTEVGGYTVIKVQFQGYEKPIGDPPTNEKSYMTTSLRGTLKSVPIGQHPKFPTDATQSFMLRLLIEGDFVTNTTGYRIGQWVPHRDDTAPVGQRDTLKFHLLEDDDDPTLYVFDTNSYNLAQLISKGIKEYDIGTFEYVVRWSQDEPLEVSDIEKLGYIVDPLGTPIKPSEGNRNWRLTTVNQEQEGTEEPSYTIELVYLLSDSGGWDTTLYSIPE